jgi:hypothetical protein
MSDLLYGRSKGHHGKNELCRKYNSLVRRQWPHGYPINGALYLISLGKT